MKTEIAKRLRLKRLEANLSQTEVAMKVGVSQVQISNWENGKGAPNEMQLVQLNSLLGPLVGSEDSSVSSDVSPFGVWLSRVRSKLNLTPAEVAVKAGVSIPTIYNLESGRSDNPQKATIEKITRALGESPSEETVQATEAAAEIEGVGNLVDFDPQDDANFPSVLACMFSMTLVKDLFMSVKVII